MVNEKIILSNEALEFFLKEEVSALKYVYSKKTPVELLINLFIKLGAPTVLFDRVATQMLINKASEYDYSPPFCKSSFVTLLPHLSIEVREKLVVHFVEKGNVDGVVLATTNYLDRSPTHSEIMGLCERFPYNVPGGKDTFLIRLKEVAEEFSPSSLPVIEYRIKELEKEEEVLRAKYSAT